MWLHPRNMCRFCFFYPLNLLCLYMSSELKFKHSFQLNLSRAYFKLAPGCLMLCIHDIVCFWTLEPVCAAFGFALDSIFDNNFSIVQWTSCELQRAAGNKEFPLFWGKCQFPFSLEWLDPGPGVVATSYIVWIILHYTISHHSPTLPSNILQL